MRHGSIARDALARDGLPCVSLSNLKPITRCHMRNSKPRPSQRSSTDSMAALISFCWPFVFFKQQRHPLHRQGSLPLAAPSISAPIRFHGYSDFALTWIGPKPSVCTISIRDSFKSSISAKRYHRTQPSFLWHEKRDERHKTAISQRLEDLRHALACRQ